MTSTRRPGYSSESLTLTMYGCSELGLDWALPLEPLHRLLAGGVGLDDLERDGNLRGWY